MGTIALAMLCVSLFVVTVMAAMRLQTLLTNRYPNLNSRWVSALTLTAAILVIFPLVFFKAAGVLGLM